MNAYTRLVMLCQDDSLSAGPTSTIAYAYSFLLACSLETVSLSRLSSPTGVSKDGFQTEANMNALERNRVESNNFRQQLHSPAY